MYWREASFGIFRSLAVAFDSMSSMVRNAPPWGIFSEQGTAESRSERDPESKVVGWWQECFSRRGIAAQQAMCGSVRHRDAETTRNKPRTNKVSFSNRRDIIARIDPGETPTSCYNSTMVILRSYWISCRTFLIGGIPGTFWLPYVVTTELYTVKGKNSVQAVRARTVSGQAIRQNFSDGFCCPLSIRIPPTPQISPALGWGWAIGPLQEHFAAPRDSPQHYWPNACCYAVHSSTFEMIC